MSGKVSLLPVTSARLQKALPAARGPRRHFQQPKRAQTAGLCTRHEVAMPLTPPKQMGKLPDLDNERRLQQPALSKSINSLLGVATLEQAKDIATSLLLSEAVYKVLDNVSMEDAIAAISSAAEQLPVQLQQSLKLQWSLPHVSHRYLVAEGDSSIYVSFMGTKLRRDLVTNAAVLQELMWKELRFSIEGEPAAHRGFITRARSIPVHDLLQLAENRKKRLVLCGHSLGGAVAEICALDLLKAAKPGTAPNMQAIGFATPAIGNAALARLVKRKGWQTYLKNYLLPEDVIGGLLGFSPLSRYPEAAAGPRTATEHSPASCFTAGDSVAMYAEMATASAHGDAGVQKDVLKGNIVPFKRKREESASGSASNTKIDILHQVESAPQRVGLASWAARLAYRVLTFPFWAHRSFVPVSQRLYLNPKGIGRKPALPQPDALAAASMVPAVLNAVTAAAAEAVTGDAAVTAGSLTQRQLILWMHRLPTYRTRLLQIGAVCTLISSQSSLQDGKGTKPNLHLVHDAAPAVRVTSAKALYPADALTRRPAVQLLLEACLRASGFQAPWPKHWQQLLDASLQTSEHNFGLRSFLKHSWHAVHGRIWGYSPVNTSETLLVKLSGSGLQHITAFNLAYPDGKRIPAEVVSSASSPVLKCLQSKLKGGKALGNFLSWLQLAVLHQDGQNLAQGESTLLIRVQVPASVTCQGLQQLGTSIKLHYQSDFYEGAVQLKGLMLNHQQAKSEVLLPWMASAPPGDRHICREC